MEMPYVDLLAHGCMRSRVELLHRSVIKLVRPDGFVSVLLPTIVIEGLA